MRALRMFLTLALLTGIIYPLIVTLIVSTTMPDQAQGDFVATDGKIVGAKRIGQKFESDKHFWSRPSAVDYNPLPSGGSNFSPTSRELKTLVAKRQEKMAKAHNVSKELVPSELVFASASGLDPHISLQAANFQIERIMKATSLKKEDIEALIQESTIKSFLGEGYINVLLLNKAIDELLKK